MDLTVYLHEGWQPRVIPAGSRRAWMDQSTDAFAYRCLPLKIANEHGWEILCPAGFEAEWTGGLAPEDVIIRGDAGARPEDLPVALFGQGVLTFHVAGLFRTPPGFNLWVTGSPNEPKDAIAPLTGVIETDWSPYTFTMNWRFTRPGQVIRFEENEPFCFFFPVERGLARGFTPRMQPLASEPNLEAQFHAWSRSRDAFHAQMLDNPPADTAARWQKLYYRGLDPAGRPATPDHEIKVRAAPFANAPTSCPRQSVQPPRGGRPGPSSPDVVALRRELAKRNWLLSTQEKLRALCDETLQIENLQNIDGVTFLREFYSRNRPVILTDAISDWPALSRWSPEYLKTKVGARPVEYQAGRDTSENYERDKDAHARTGPFSDFIDAITSDQGNNLYLTAYNSRLNGEALKPLWEDVGFLSELMQPGGAHDRGMMWIGPAGTYTPPHHDLTNNLLIQLVGRKRVALVAPSGSPQIYNDQHVFSRIHDLTSVDLQRFPAARGLPVVEVDLMPGEMLFIPIGWWHQVLSLDFSVSVTQTNFRWPNAFHAEYDADA